MIDVLIAMPELDSGGPDRVMFELLRKLDRRRFRPSLLVSRPTGHYLSKLPGDVSIQVLGDSPSLSDRYPVGRTLRAIWRRVPTVILCTQRMILTLGALAPVLPRGTRVIARQANDMSADFAGLVASTLLKHRIARRALVHSLRRADAVVCQSYAMEADLRRLLGPRANLGVIYNPIDVDEITKIVSGRQPGLPGQPALVSVGRLSRQKGYDILLPALQPLRSRYPSMHLTIFGDGPDRPRLVALARELGMADMVTFAGYTTDHLPRVASADLFLLASRYEGFPNAALEALACGTPVVLTNCPGANAEIVRPGTDGQLASAVTAEAMTMAIARALEECARYDRVRIRQGCASRFGAAQIVSKYEDLFAAR